MKVNIGKFKKNDNPRTIKIQIDPWDTWNVDSTLSIIIEPMLIQFKESKGGYPCKDYNECESCSCEKDWDEILDKMIFAFHSLNTDWESQHHSGNFDDISIPVDTQGNVVDEKDAVFFKVEHGPNHTHVFDKEGYFDHDRKIQEGLELFGKHFRSLWT